MIKWIFKFLSVYLFFFLMIKTGLQANTLRIATYNIWNPIFEEKYSGQNTWSQRLSFIVENIISSESDVICLQEVEKSSYLDLVQNPEINNRYTSFYISHAPKQEQTEGRDGLAFFYNPKNVTLVKLVQSLDGTRPNHRRDFYVDLKLNEQRNSPVYFRVACTHLDSEKDLTIGNRQLSALVEDILQIDNTKDIDFVVVCGDFNEGESEPIRPRYEIMQKADFITDGAIDTTRPEALNVRHNGHVDWIYFKKISSLNFHLTPLMPIGEENASDHKLTRTAIEIF